MANPFKNRAVWGIVVLCLAGIGFISQLIYNTGWLLLLAGVTGTIIYLYKKPPNWLIRMTQSSQRRSRSHQKSAQQSKRRFRVIHGNKKNGL